MIIALLLLLGGLVLTVYGANWLVDGASSLAKKMKISNSKRLNFYPTSITELRSWVSYKNPESDPEVIKNPSELS